MPGYTNEKIVDDSATVSNIDVSFTSSNAIGRLLRDTDRVLVDSLTRAQDLAIALERGNVVENDVEGCFRETGFAGG